MVTSGSPTFKAQAASGGIETRKLRNYAASSASTLTAKRLSAVSASEWRPNQVQVDITHSQSKAYFSYYAAWYSGASPHNVPDNYGFEIGVSLYNSATPRIPFGVRPLGCNDGANSQFFAKQYGWSWSVLNSNYTALPKSIRAYADTNDYLDPCNRNNMSIGIASPHSIPLSPNNEGYALLFTVIAPKGTQSTNVISADMQLVSDAFCGLSLNSTSLTDCMGASERTPVDTSIPTARQVFNKSNNLSAPDRCWLSDNFGTTPWINMGGGATGCGY